MIIVPAVDIRGGRCVRLLQGRSDRETVYRRDPSDAALRWQREGARYLHVVDLDGAFSGEPQNLGTLRTILERVTIPLEFGGGLRSIEAIRLVFRMGVDRVVLGTAALSDRDLLKRAVAEFGRQVFVSLDVREGFLSIEGWRTPTKMRPIDILGELEEIGVGGLIYTDILTDGALSGPDTEALDELLAACRIRLIASGGIASIEHIRELGRLRGGRLYGAIIGRALYTGDITLRDALPAACFKEERK